MVQKELESRKVIQCERGRRPHLVDGWTKLPGKVFQGSEIMIAIPCAEKHLSAILDYFLFYLKNLFICEGFCVSTCLISELDPTLFSPKCGLIILDWKKTQHEIELAEQARNSGMICVAIGIGYLIPNSICCNLNPAQADALVYLLENEIQNVVYCTNPEHKFFSFLQSEEKELDWQVREIRCTTYTAADTENQLQTIVQEISDKKSRTALILEDPYMTDFVQDMYADETLSNLSQLTVIGMSHIKKQRIFPVIELDLEKLAKSVRNLFLRIKSEPYRDFPVRFHFPRFQENP